MGQSLLEFIRPRNCVVYRWRSLPRIRRYRASSPQGTGTLVPVTSVAYHCSGKTTDHFLCASVFPRPLLLYRIGVCSLGALKSYFVFFGAQEEEPRLFFFFSAPQIRGLLSCVSVAVFARQRPRKMRTPPSPHICSNIEGGWGGGGGGTLKKKKKAPPSPTKNGLKKKIGLGG